MNDTKKPIDISAIIVKMTIYFATAMLLYMKTDTHHFSDNIFN